MADGPVGMCIRFGFVWRSLRWGPTSELPWGVGVILTPIKQLCGTLTIVTLPELSAHFLLSVLLFPHTLSRFPLERGNVRDIRLCQLLCSMGLEQITANKGEIDHRHDLRLEWVSHTFRAPSPSEL